MIDYFDRGARIAHDRPCMVSDEEGVRTYAEVRARSCRIANALIADGFPAGAHGAVLSGNAPVAFEAILGLLRADGVWVMANHRAGVEENAYLLDLLDVDTLFVHSEVADRIARLRSDCPRIRSSRPMSSWRTGSATRRRRRSAAMAGRRSWPS
jgi:acyl-CoA synthetase (AMP-forming)/AMP-acid ligase II